MSAGRRLRLSPRQGPAAGIRRTTAVALCAVALYAGLASGVKPFTALAYAAATVPFALCIGVLVLQRLRPDAGPWRRLDPARPESEGTGIVWLALIVVLLGVELASYFHPGPRADYPTLSFGLDALLRYRAVNAAGWFAWIVLGWYLARR
ncbi:MAG: hypothetical protein M0010_02675 [Actinomycetota bacterium]|nr:hypothetical protein [Actinomycetota bacterium]